MDQEHRLRFHVPSPPCHLALIGRVISCCTSRGCPCFHIGEGMDSTALEEEMRNRSPWARHFPAIRALVATDAGGLFPMTEIDRDLVGVRK